MTHNVLKFIHHVVSVDNQKRETGALVLDKTLIASRKIMDELRFETKAPYSLLLNLYNHTMIDSGDPGGIDKTILNPVLISSMAASHELAQVFNEKYAFDVHYYAGERYEIYLRRVNAEIIMALLIDLQQTNISMGGVRLHLKRAVESIKQISEQLLAMEKDEDIEKVEPTPQETSQFSNSLDDLLFGDEKPAGE